jgi:hypothetical protein
MKKISCAAMVACAFVASAAEPSFKTGVKLNVGDKPIAFEVGHLVPAVADWNGDGKKDLIVGHFMDKDGNVKLFINTGSDAAPVFEKEQSLMADNKPIRLEAG